MLAPKTMQVGVASVTEPLEEIDLSNDSNIKRPISISSQMSVDKKQQLTELLKKY